MKKREFPFDNYDQYEVSDIVEDSDGNIGVIVYVSTDDECRDGYPEYKIHYTSNVIGWADHSELNVFREA